jgi:hypothetical protein
LLWNSSVDIDDSLLQWCPLKYGSNAAQVLMPKACGDLSELNIEFSARDCVLDLSKCFKYNKSLSSTSEVVVGDLATA